MSVGYFQLGLGKRYIDESCDFIWSLRAFKDNYPVSILVKKEDYNYALSKKVFDKVIIFSENDPLFTLCKNDFERYCLYPRLKLLDYTPYRECVVIDTDAFCVHDTDKAWDTFRDKGQPFNCTGNYYDPSYHWSQLNVINEKLGMNITCAHGGIFYINLNFGREKLETFFLHLMYAFVNYDKLGFSRNFENREFDKSKEKGAMTDEILFGYALSKMNFTLLDFGLHSIMTFEIDGYLVDEMKLPVFRQTYKEYTLYWEKYKKDIPIIMKDPIPFVHVFGYGHQKVTSSDKIKKAIKCHI